VWRATWCCGQFRSLHMGRASRPRVDSVCYTCESGCFWLFISLRRSTTFCYLVVLVPLLPRAAAQTTALDSHRSRQNPESATLRIRDLRGMRRASLPSSMRASRRVDRGVAVVLVLTIGLKGGSSGKCYNAFRLATLMTTAIAESPAAQPVNNPWPPPRTTSSSINSMIERNAVGPCGWPQTSEQP
jgi:hypothetical protein